MDAGRRVVLAAAVLDVVMNGFPPHGATLRVPAGQRRLVAVTESGDPAEALDALCSRALFGLSKIALLEYAATV